MARMHARRRGKSGSKKPPIKIAPDWAPDKEKVEALVVQLAKQGHGPSAIGRILRDQYGVPSVKAICGDSITKILERHNLKPKIPEDLRYLLEKALRIQKHLSNPIHGKRDTHNKRALHLVEMKIRRLSDYYKRTGKLPHDWKYDREKISILLGGI